jgi:hypothetical protein
MSIIVKRIDEPDFGCEGVPDNKPICDRVTLSVDTEELVLEVPEKTVWQSKIDEGMEISSELLGVLKNEAI